MESISEAKTYKVGSITLADLEAVNPKIIKIGKISTKIGKIGIAQYFESVHVLTYPHDKSYLEFLRVSSIHFHCSSDDGAFDLLIKQK